MLSKEIRQALQEFREIGVFPTWRQLAVAVGRPTLFNSAYARRILKNTIREDPRAPRTDAYRNCDLYAI